jgi:hypothetical protein
MKKKNTLNLIIGLAVGFIVLIMIVMKSAEIKKENLDRNISLGVSR